MAVSIDRLFERLGKLSVSLVAGCYNAGSAMAEYLGPKFKGDQGPEAKKRYQEEMALFGDKCERLWGAGKEKAQECLDIFRLCSAIPKAKEVRIEEVRPLLKLLAPIKPANGFKTTWVTKDTDAPGFSRKAVAIAVVEDLVAKEISGPTAVAAKIKELVGELEKECLEKASEIEREEHATIKKGEEVKKNQRERTRVENKARELGVKVGVSSPSDVARKLVVDNQFRVDVARELVKISAERDSDDPLRVFESVLATFGAEAKVTV